MDPELVRSGWAVFNVLATRRVSVSVRTEAGMYIAVTFMMSQYPATLTIRQIILVRIVRVVKA